jgi:hypothetical protein
LSRNVEENLFGSRLPLIHCGLTKQENEEVAAGKVGEKVQTGLETVGKNGFWYRSNGS